MFNLRLVHYPVFVFVLSILFCSCASSGDNQDANSAAYEETSDEQQLTRETQSGLIKGLKDNSTLSWLGIPFAKPPVGDLRWRAPRDPDSWDGVRDATSFGSACTQYGTILYILDEKLYGKPTGCEDCLYLNIWRPATDETNLPVLFYIHGGANVIGASSLPVYNGANLSRKTNMVVVTANYRLGIMGWFSHPSLRDGDALDSSGNYGTLDLIKALEWVQNNAASFGGNPGNVTVCGQSAGAFNIHSLLASPLAGNLFHKAIMHSGFPVSTKVQKGDERAYKVIVRLMIQDGLAADEETATALIEDKGSAWLASYMRSVPAYEIYNPDVSTASGSTKESGTTSFGIYEDGTVIKQNVYDTLKQGGYHKVPVMLGCMSEELKLFLMMLGVETHKLHGLIKQHRPDSANLEFSDFFPAALKPLYNTVTSAGQIVFQGYGVDITASMLARYQDNVYAYRFEFNDGARPFEYLLGSAHAFDVPFLFGNFLSPGKSLVGCEWNNANRIEREHMSDIVMSYWSSFARYGDPNTGNSLPRWQKFSNSSGGKNRMILDTGNAYMSRGSAGQEQSTYDKDPTEDLNKEIESFVGEARK
jgi:para-nitrobenzyl esterase